jgi:hypothetical protein
MTSNNQVLILLDADVTIHLFKADKISLLNILYPDRVRMLDIVLSELLKSPTMRSEVENLFRFKQIEEITFPTSSNPQLLKEYISLRNIIKGPGERACLLCCKYYQHIIASSNTKDIKPYCKEHSIAYLTTLDILVISIYKGILTNQEVNECIKKITFNDLSYLCCRTIDEHKAKHFDSIKLGY